MRGLEQGITQLANYEMNAKVRTNAISLLNGIIEDLNAGIKVWESFLQSGNVGSDPGAFGGWAGFSIEKKLFEIDLEARDKARAASGGKSSLADNFCPAALVNSSFLKCIIVPCCSFNRLSSKINDCRWF